MDNEIILSADAVALFCRLQMNIKGIYQSDLVKWEY
jgi:hypothetical protein